MDEDLQFMLIKLMALLCVRNTSIEAIHQGRMPVTQTGDYSDVKVIDSIGHEIPWCEVSRINQVEMAQFMKEVVNKLYSFDQMIQNPAFIQALASFEASICEWDNPCPDQYIQSLLDSQKLRERLKMMKSE